VRLWISSTSGSRGNIVPWSIDLCLFNMLLLENGSNARSRIDKNYFIKKLLLSLVSRCCVCRVCEDCTREEPKIMDDDYGA
jgi:hypothetical protein